MNQVSFQFILQTLSRSLICLFLLQEGLSAGSRLFLKEKVEELERMRIRFKVRKAQLLNLQKLTDTLARDPDLLNAPENADLRKRATERLLQLREVPVVRTQADFVSYLDEMILRLGYESPILLERATADMASLLSGLNPKVELPFRPMTIFSLSKSMTESQFQLLVRFALQIENKILASAAALVVAEQGMRRAELLTAISGEEKHELIERVQGLVLYFDKGRKSKKPAIAERSKLAFENSLKAAEILVSSGFAARSDFQKIIPFLDPSQTNASKPDRELEQLAASVQVLIAQQLQSSTPLSDDARASCLHHLSQIKLQLQKTKRP